MRPCCLEMVEQGLKPKSFDTNPAFIPSSFVVHLLCVPGTQVLAMVPACKELTLVGKSLSFLPSCVRQHHFLFFFWT